MAIFGTPDDYTKYCQAAIPGGYALMSTDIATDLITLMIPIPIVMSLKMSPWTRVLTLLTFMVGGLSVAASCVKAYIYVEASLGRWTMDAICMFYITTHPLIFNQQLTIPFSPPHIHRPMEPRRSPSRHHRRLWPDTPTSSVQSIPIRENRLLHVAAGHQPKVKVLDRAAAELRQGTEPNREFREVEEERAGPQQYESLGLG